MIINTVYQCAVSCFPPQTRQCRPSPCRASAMRLSKEIITGATKDLARCAVHAQFADLLVALKKNKTKGTNHSEIPWL